MKELQDGTVGFYESKLMLFFIFIGIALLLGVPMYFAMGINPNSDDIFAIGAYFFIITLVFLKFLFSLFAAPMVIVSEDYIKLRGFPELLWQDIAQLYIERRYVVGQKRRQWVITATVFDLSKYNLSLWQKIKIKFGAEPFVLNISMLGKKERARLADYLSAFKQFKVFEEKKGFF